MTERKFNRHDAVAIRKATRGYVKQSCYVEAGTRHDLAGVLTADSTRWDDDTDLVDVVELDTVREQIAPGFTLDLYIFDRNHDAGDGLLLNLDAHWDGTAWKVYDPFRPGYAVTEAPR